MRKKHRSKKSRRRDVRLTIRERRVEALRQRIVRLRAERLGLRLALRFDARRFRALARLTRRVLKLARIFLDKVDSRNIDSSSLVLSVSK